MKLTLFAFAFFVSQLALAEIQVPEDCINHAYPCLVRADSLLEFKQSNLKITLTPKSILKITKDSGQINLELLAGRMSVKESSLSDESVSVNSIVIDGPDFMIKRDHDKLDLVSLTKFTRTHYSISAQDNIPVRVKSNFLSKNDFVDFTRHYFSSLSGFKNFLAATESKWAAEFQKQNENQTKALIRSVASEEKNAEERIRQQQEKARALKKAKEELFFRTFQR
jgi:hypothetical protein